MIQTCRVTSQPLALRSGIEDEAAEGETIGYRAGIAEVIGGGRQQSNEEEPSRDCQEHEDNSAHGRPPLLVSLCRQRTTRHTCASTLVTLEDQRCAPSVHLQ